MSFFAVYNELGAGFLESVYRNALVRVLQEAGLQVQQEVSIDVFFRGASVGHFCADVVVEDRVVLELKATRSLLPEHHAQLLNYLRATRIEVGLLLNFGSAPDFKRLIYSNGRKRPIVPR